jgi:hypothetical protein
MIRFSPIGSRSHDETLKETRSGRERVPTASIRRCGRRQRTGAGQTPEVGREPAARQAGGNGERGSEPATADDPRQGKPLQTCEPHGRARVRTPGRSDEEHAAEVVETARAAPQPVLANRCRWTHRPRTSKGNETPREALRRQVPGVPVARGRPAGGSPTGHQPQERRPNRSLNKTTVAVSANTSRVGAARRKAEDGGTKADQVPRAHRDALQGRSTQGGGGIDRMPRRLQEREPLKGWPV